MTRSPRSQRSSSKSRDSTTSVEQRRYRECQISVHNTDSRISNIDTRLTAIEHADIRTADRLAAAEKTHVAFETKQDKILERLERIEQDLTKYKGAWGTAMMVVMAMWAAVVAFKDWFAAHWK